LPVNPAFFSLALLLLTTAYFLHYLTAIIQIFAPVQKHPPNTHFCIFSLKATNYNYIFTPHPTKVLEKIATLVPVKLGLK